MTQRRLSRSMAGSALAAALLSWPAYAGTPLLINEVDADTPGTDAAEFVELYDGGQGNYLMTGKVLVFYNGSAASDASYFALDLDGYSTDANGYFVVGNAGVAGVDVVFPDNTLQNGADAVALYYGDATSFPNGTALTTTGLIDALVYDTSDADDPGLLVLLNAAQPQVDENANSASATESNQRCPNGAGGQRNTTSYDQWAPTAGSANLCMVAITEIHDVQGSGNASPLAGNSVTVEGIVTGVKSNGFFVQEELADEDADELTSEGIFVFTSAAPPVAATVGNRVQVTGTVAEFVPSSDPVSRSMTELTSPSVVQTATGQTLPSPVNLSATLPSPGGGIDSLEKLEGMRVSAASLNVVAPTLGSTDEVNATGSSNGVFVGVIAPNPRPFREPGLQAPETGGPSVPIFDNNPERIRVDSDALVGAAAIDVGFGATVTNVTGPLDYGFRTWTIDPDPSAAVPAGAPTPGAVSVPTAAEFTVASYNLERFFDDVDDLANPNDPVLTTTALNNRLAKASLQIRDYLRYPDIIAVEEVENTALIGALATKINVDAGVPNPGYDAFLVEGNDVGGIDVGFLIKTATFGGGINRVELVSYTQELDGTTWIDPADGLLHTLNDRPPLRMNAIVHHESGEQFPITVIVVHQRSLNGINSTAPDGLTTAGDRVRQKRRAQAEDLANLVQTRQIADPAERILVLGDYNAFEFNDGYVDVMGTVKGTPTPADQVLLASADLVNPDLTRLADASNYSFLFDGNAQNLDHALVNAPLVAATSARLEHGRFNADFPETDRGNYTAGNPRRLGDHDPLVAYFAVPAFATTIFKDGFETGNTLRWSSTAP